MSTPPTSPSRETTSAPSRSRLQSAVAATASTLQAEVLGERGDAAQSRARAALARLRRSAGREPEADPLGFQEALDLLLGELAPSDLGTSGTATQAERAAFHALTLFALHMQSARRPMHIPGRSFGSAAGILISAAESSSTKPRVDALMAARTERSRLTHARSLITLLRDKEIGLDYGLFARDLRTLTGRYRSSVLLRWGRDLVTAPYRATDAAASSTSDSGDEPTSPQP